MTERVHLACELGERVLRRWRTVRQRPAAFAALAYDELASALSALVAPADAWLDELALHDDLPPLASPAARAFGEPPVRVWERAGMAVDVYFWLGPMTALHDHGFSGAFGVIDGPSLHTTYRFVSPDPVDAPVQVGRVERTATELLVPGDLRAITGEDRLPHRVVHLGAPSLSICVRTVGKARVPQRTFFAPSLSVVSDEFVPAIARHRIGLALHLFRRHPPDAAVRVARLIDGLPDFLAFWTLWQPFLAQADAGLVLQVIGSAAPRPWFDALASAMFEAARTTMDWGHVTGALPRFERALAMDALPEPERAALRSRFDPFTAPAPRVSPSPRT